jgi:hypothetical protein
VYTAEREREYAMPIIQERGARERCGFDERVCGGGGCRGRKIGRAKSEWLRASRTPKIMNRIVLYNTNPEFNFVQLDYFFCF